MGLEKKELSSGLSGVAGEYFVAAELSRLGFIASVTLRNSRGIDILATSPAGRSISIQVKTNQFSKRDWLLKSNVEKEGRPDHFFVFVNLNGSGAPTFHIVPSNVVAEYCRRSHEEWLESPGKGGRAHRDTPMRRFADAENRHLSRWDLLT